MVSAAQPLVGRKPAVAVAMIGVTLYTILVGADASVVRAAVMGSLYLVASRLLGRPSFPYASLFLAGFVMTLANPMTLWDVGFQLSFSATLGLMLYADPLTDWTQTRLRRWLDRETVQRLMGILSEAVLLTLAAQVITLPLMMAYFDQLSLISLAANALVLPAQPGVMLWGGLATLVGLVLPTLGQLLGWVAWLFLAYTIALVRVLAQVPYAAVPVSLSPAAIVLLFAAITGLTWLAKLRTERRHEVVAFLRQNVTVNVALGFSLMAAILSLAWAYSQPDGQLHVAFLDVGQGDAILITTPSGRQLLVDGGMYPSVLNEALGRQLPFWDRTLDAVVATHPDADHVAGLLGVFDRYDVARLLTNGAGLGESDVYDGVLRAAADRNTTLRPLQVGEVLRIDDGVALTVLHPAAALSGSRNDDSVVLRLTYGDFSLLLPGDIEGAGETAVMAAGLPPSLVLKAGHHGADTSSSVAWLMAVQPQVTIISAGADNNFGHPAPEMLARAEAAGTAVLRTDELGTIEVISDGNQMWWQAGP